MECFVWGNELESQFVWVIVIVMDRFRKTCFLTKFRGSTPSTVGESTTYTLGVMPCGNAINPLSPEHSPNVSFKPLYEVLLTLSQTTKFRLFDTESFCI